MRLVIFLLSIVLIKAHLILRLSRTIEPDFIYEIVNRTNYSR